jgi:Ca2+-binding RTX toxin-like protein
LTPAYEIRAPSKSPPVSNIATGGDFVELSSISRHLFGMKLVALFGLSIVLPLVPSVEAAMPRCLGKRATLVGTPGPDHLRATKKADVIVTGDGDDVVERAGYGDRVCTGRGDDRISGSEGQLKGGRGDDYIQASNADAFGGPGRDVLRAHYGEVFGGPGNDRLRGGYTIDGGSGNDRMIATPHCHPAFIAGSGDDYMVGGSGRCEGDRVYSSSLNLTEAPRGVRLNLAEKTLTGWGNDTVRHMRFIYGSRFDDVLIGDFRRNSMSGQGGDDVLRGGAGRDVLDGDDFYEDGAGEGGSAGYDVLIGGAGSDRLYGHEDDDELRAGSGDDWVDGGMGSDNMDGGSGVDVISFWHDHIAGDDSGIHLDLAQGTSSGRGKDSLAGFEGVEGTSFDDVLVGDDSATTFVPFFGDDQVLAGGGDDVIVEYAPGYWPVAGNDAYDGGEGFDVLSWEGLRGEPIVADMSTGTASGQGDDRFTGIEGLIGSTREDVLTGDDEANLLIGEDGDDHLDGREGSDVINGGAGTDVCLNGEEQTDCP